MTVLNHIGTPSEDAESLPLATSRLPTYSFSFMPALWLRGQSDPDNNRPYDGPLFARFRREGFLPVFPATGCPLTAGPLISSISLIRMSP